MESTVLGRGSFAVLGRFAHGPDEHRDPAEEGFSSSSVVFTTDGQWRFHGHDGWVDVDGGTVVLGHAGDSYRCAHASTHPNDRTLYLTLDDGALHTLLAGHPDAGLLDEPLPPKRSVPLDTRLAARMRELAAREDESALRLDCLALELLLDLRERVPRLRPTRRHADAIEDARRFLDQRFAEPIDLALLARRAHVSPFHFHRLFREQVGVPPHHYLVERRLARAAELLRSGLSVAAAGAAVGYASPNHFATAFRRRFGLAPSKFA
jgi:AraC family transcriptional regulator